jgi:hypothetical protein
VRGFRHLHSPSVPDVVWTPGTGLRNVRRDRSEGARGVNSRGTTLLAEPSRLRGPCISRLFLSWEPPTWAYLPYVTAFFGQPLQGPFQAVSRVPGSHHPRVACAVTACTAPRLRGKPLAEIRQPRGELLAIRL